MDDHRRIESALPARERAFGARTGSLRGELLGDEKNGDGDENCTIRRHARPLKRDGIGRMATGLMKTEHRKHYGKRVP
jgi:hypothetical protein